MRLSVLIVFFYFTLFSINTYAEELLTWQDCVQEAQKNHPDLISAQENISQYKAAKDIVKSGLFPQIDGSVSATASNSADTYSYGFSASQLLFDGSKTIDKVKSASETISASTYNYRFVSSEVRFRLRTAFINLLKAQEEVAIAQDIYRIRRGDLQLITMRYLSGMEHKGALLTAEANVSQAEFGIVQAKRNIETGQRELLKEMGRSQFVELKVKENFTIKTALEEKPDFSAIAVNNPSYTKLLARRNAASYDLKAAYADFLPEASASANAKKKSSSWPPEDDQLDMGLSVSLPLFEGGLRRSQVNQARAILNQAEAQAQSSYDSIVLTLSQSWQELKDAWDTVKVEEKFLKASEERSKIAEAQYSSGFISYDNWTIIQDNLVEAKNSYLDARANALAAEAKWIQAKGETLEYAP